MKRLGLIGYPLGHSFSKKYYLDKFQREDIRGIDYDLYPLTQITDFPALFHQQPDFIGVNVTIPYKQSVIPYLDQLSLEAQEIGAVNCIRIDQADPAGPVLHGYNTDAFGFEQSLRPLLDPDPKKALVFGNGGASKAVIFVLRKLGIPYQIVSRTPGSGQLAYPELTPELIAAHRLLINCTPLGTYPNTDACPDIPYSGIGSSHLLYDLIYNPEETLFLTRGKQAGAQIKNGYEMLVLQAERNWQIWMGS